MNTAIKKGPGGEFGARTNPILQDEVNRTVYYSRFVYLYYLSKSLLPVEATFFAKYRPYLLGRDILDVGVGAGRTARYLAPLARHYEAIDYSPVMVKYLKKKMPQISVRQADFRDLTAFEDGSFDFVFATANVIDALSHDDRLRALSESARVLRPGGLLAFSTHNLHYKKAFLAPQFDWSRNPIKLGLNVVKYALGKWNHARIAPLRTKNSEYALLNDTGHFYGCLHYYVARSTVRAQLCRRGIRLLDVFDAWGRVVLDTEDDSESPNLFYVGQKDSGYPDSAQPLAAGAETIPRLL